jgi:hypothetical protein
MDKSSITMALVSTGVLALLFSGIAILHGAGPWLWAVQILLTWAYITIVVFHISSPAPSLTGYSFSFFTLWYFFGLLFFGILCMQWPLIAPLWFILQNTFLIQGSQILIQKERRRMGLHFLLPIKIYLYIIVGTPLLAVFSHFLRFQLQIQNYGSWKKWTFLFLAYIIPLVFQSSLFIYAGFLERIKQEIQANKQAQPCVRRKRR